MLGQEQTLQLGTKFETNLAGQDVFASIQEFEPMTRLAWGGFPKGAEESPGYHAWIITPTAAGCHIWTEETMRGTYWIDLAKKAPDGLWLTHEKLLRNLARIGSEREAGRF